LSSRYSNGINEKNTRKVYGEEGHAAQSKTAPRKTRIRFENFCKIIICKNIDCFTS
jgi:hypothetical protein